MSGYIKKIEKIENMAVFKDFQWSRYVRDEGNNVSEFKKINILYGRNYSVKTTLSRIFRAIEIGSLSDKYNNPEFQVVFDEGGVVCQKSLKGHGQIVRVFNEDFVRENLRFIVDDQEAINSFAILGEDNAKIEDEIKELTKGLGSEEERSGLIGEYLESESVLKKEKGLLDSKELNLETKLRDKANKAGTGIKHNKVFGNATYNLPKLKLDIEKVLKPYYRKLSDLKVERCYGLLKEESKVEVPESKNFNLIYSSIAMKAKGLVEKKIKASDPIQELLNDSLLASWVRDGRKHHEGNRTSCAFCGNELPKVLWEKLDKHFSQESEQLLSAIDLLLLDIEEEQNRLPSLLKINNTLFYSSFSGQLDELRGLFSKCSNEYNQTLENIKEQLIVRQRDVFNPILFDEPTPVSVSLNQVRFKYEKIREKSNSFTKSLSSQQEKSRKELCLHEVFGFLVDIKYAEECEDINELETAVVLAKDAQSTAKSKVEDKRKLIDELKAELKDESKGADKVNEYLMSFFGHQSLSLKAIEETVGSASAGCRFEVVRHDEKAFHLSEGECSLIAFCYFIAKLDDIETKGNQPVIWIDDPISSLDSNHIFFIYSLINSEIASPYFIDKDGEKKELDKFKQLFVSTHNLDFLKYLKRLPGAGNKKKSQYFIINRMDHESYISLMPRYMKEYVTEFNYLFSQIHKCASIQVVDDHNYTSFYNFGNNARKFFEIYLYYKYPNKGMNEETLYLFFGNDKVPAILIDRINNEYSHLAGVFERGATPTEVPEMKKAAEAILERIEEKDPDQYQSLLDSIGVSNG